MSDGITKKEFDDFKDRLYFHNIDRAGVDKHITANPIFNVETKRRVYGVSESYTDSFIWVDKDDSENKHDSLDDLFESILSHEEDEYEKIKKQCVDEDLDIENLSNSEMEDMAEDTLTYEKIGYIEQWEYINSHLTREGAEVFIKRKSHDYGEMRIWVGSQYYCWEFNDIIKGILDGKIGYID